MIKTYLKKIWKDPTQTMLPNQFVDKTSAEIFPNRAAIIHGKISFTCRKPFQDAGNQARLDKNGIRKGDTVALRQHSSVQGESLSYHTRCSYKPYQYQARL